MLYITKTQDKFTCLTGEGRSSSELLSNYLSNRLAGVEFLV